MPSKFCTKIPLPIDDQTLSPRREEMTEAPHPESRVIIFVPGSLSSFRSFFNEKTKTKIEI